MSLSSHPTQEAHSRSQKLVPSRSPWRLGIALGGPGGWLLITCFLGACTTTPNWPKAAEDALLRAELGEAIAYYELAARENDADDAVKVRLALLLVRDAEQLLQKGEWPLAQQRLHRAEQLGGDAVTGERYWQLRLELGQSAGLSWPEEAELLEHLEGESALDAARRLAEGWDRAAELEKAVLAYQRLLELQPDDAQVRLRWVQLLLELEQAQTALEQLERMVDAEPQSVILKVTMSQALEQLERLDEAETVLRAAAAQAPEQVGAWRRLLGFCQRHQRPCSAEAQSRIEALSPPPSENKKRPLR